MVGSKTKKIEIRVQVDNENSIIKYVVLEKKMNLYTMNRGSTMTNSPIPDHDHDLLEDGLGDVMDDGVELSLTRNEALYIDDSLSMLIEREGDANLMNEHRVTTVRPLTPTAGLPAPLELIEKIGMAVLFTTDPSNGDKEAVITLDATDLLMLREVAHSYVRIGEEPVGYNLKKKIYTVLYDVEYQKTKFLNNLLDGVDTSVLNNPVVVPKE